LQFTVWTTILKDITTEVAMAQVSAYTVSRVVMVVVGVLVAAAIVIGVIFLLHNRGEQVRHDQASQLAAQELKQQQSDNAKVPTESPNKGTVSAPSAPGKTVATTTADLPKTGMSSDLMSLVALAIVTFAAASYLVSRQRVKAL
jgi:LPXTG-motif cell wall-anchored protein